MVGQHLALSVLKSTQMACLTWLAEMPKGLTMDNKACNYVLGEIQKLRDRGGGSVRENPARSLHWWTSAEVAMWESGQWVDTSYAACTLGGTRCKHQVLRHNVEEIQRWPPANCHHVHDPQEWTPYTSDGIRVYPVQRRGRVHGNPLLSPLQSQLVGGQPVEGWPSCMFLACPHSWLWGDGSIGWTWTLVQCESGQWHL